MCECSKGYVCPQHTARANVAAKPQTVAKRHRGMTIRQAIAVMQANRNPTRTFARNKETFKAARILMGAYYSSGNRSYSSLQQIVEKFSQTGGATTPPKVIVSGGMYEIMSNSVGYFVVYRRIDGIVRYLSKSGEERTSCIRNDLDGSGGYFRTKSDAEEAIAANKNRGGVDWKKIAKEIPTRSHTIERTTLTSSSSVLLNSVRADDIVLCLKKSGFPEVSTGHVYLPKPITEIGYYKVLLQFPFSVEIYVNIWVVPA
jgi:ribosomal protein L9